MFKASETEGRELLDLFKELLGSFGSFLPHKNDQKVFACIMKFPYICANLYKRYIFAVLCNPSKTFSCCQSI